MCGLGEKMIPNYTHERIPRRAECLQWDGKNTDEILGFLAKNSIIGELYRGNEYILIKQDGCIATSIRHGIWILKGEDGVIRYYSDSQHKLMYRPISDELERYKAFAREIIAKGSDDLSVLSAGVRYKLLVPRKCGLALDLADSLKERS